jgi:hypothetical protein
MQSVVAESTQQMLRPGKCTDIYYPDGETARKQCFATTVNTRFRQDFSNLGGGSSTLMIPPSNGVQDIIATLVMPGVSAPAGLALSRGWGYALIKSVNYRIGGSTDYSITGAQCLQNALRQMPDAKSRDDLFNFGGEECRDADLAAPNTAFVYLALPWCVPSSEGKLPPLPTDLLTQGVQIRIELNDVASIFSINTPQGGTAPAPPTALSSAWFTVQQLALQNQGDALARRIDMTSHALSYPAEFVQSEIAIPLQNAAGPQSVSLTGFRSGEVKSIEVFLTKGSDTASSTKQLNAWYAPTDVQLSYAGQLFARFDSTSGSL